MPAARQSHRCVPPLDPPPLLRQEPAAVGGDAVAEPKVWGDDTVLRSLVRQRERLGALAVDVLPVLADEIRGKTVVCVTSGGNFDFERLPEVKERAQRHSGLKKYFILRMPQRPGALREFLNFLGPDDDIARFEYLKKSARNFGSVLIGIETKRPDAFAALTAKLDAAGVPWTPGRDIP